MQISIEIVMSFWNIHIQSNDYASPTTSTVCVSAEDINEAIARVKIIHPTSVIISYRNKGEALVEYDEVLLKKATYSIQATNEKPSKKKLSDLFRTF